MHHAHLIISLLTHAPGLTHTHLPGPLSTSSPLLVT